MNKKADFKRIVGIMILIVVLIILMVTYFTPKGLLARVSSIAGDWSDKVLSEIMDKGGETTVDKTLSGESMTTAFSNLFTTFLEAKNYQNKTEKCILDLSVLPLNFEDHKITIEELGDGIFFNLINPENQLLGQVTVENLELCAVYGSTHIPNFYNAWIINPTMNPYNEFRDLDETKLVFEKGNMFTCDNCGNLENQEFKIKLPFLYKPTKDKVCFITTDTSWGGCSEYPTVIDSQCDEEIKANIPYCN